MESSIATAELSIFFSTPRQSPATSNIRSKPLTAVNLLIYLTLQRQIAVLDQKTAFLTLKTLPLDRLEAQVIRSC